MLTNLQIHIHRSQKNEDIDGKGVQVYDQGYAYIDRHRDTGVYQICGTRKRKHQGGYEYTTEHKIIYMNMAISVQDMEEERNAYTCLRTQELEK